MPFINEEVLQITVIVITVKSHHCFFLRHSPPPKLYFLEEFKIQNKGSMPQDDSVLLDVQEFMRLSLNELKHNLEFLFLITSALT